MSLEVYPQSGPPGPIGPTASVLFSAGTLSSVRSDITFNNSNGVTFGLDGGGVITATVQTNYQSAGAYLTTAALSQDSSKYAGTTAGMTGGSLTVDTAGVAISLPAYLTTAQPPGAYLTTAMASNRGSDFVQATAGFFGTNATGTIASDGISVSVNAGGGSLNISAGSTSSNVSAVTFSNGSGVTFGFDGSNVTASVQTNYQTPGAYLTTAALSQDSSKYAGTNGSVETTSGTDLALTLNTSGATIAYPKWLTTAMQSGASTISNVNISAGSTSSNVSAVTFSNANGVSFGYDGTNVTATVATNYQSQGAYLTTAALSQDSSKYAGTGFTTATTAGTNIVGTLNTSGLSMGIPAYLTTTPAGGAGTGFTSTSTAGSNVVGTLNSNGLSVGVPNYLTTAMASNATTLSNILVKVDTETRLISSAQFINAERVTFLWAGTDTSLNQIAASFNIVVGNSLSAASNVVGLQFNDSNGVTWGVINDTAVARLADVTASVRTNYAGTATSVATTTGTDLSFAANTSGITIAYPKWLTAASGAGAGTGFTTATTAGTAVVGTLDSNGLSMGVPAYLTTAMASNAATISNIKVSAGTLSNNLSAITFSDSNGISWGLNTNSVITATVKTDYQTSGAYLTTAALSQDSSKYAGTATSVVTTTGTDLSMALNTNGLTVAYPKWITTAAAGGGVAVSNSQTLFSTGTVALSEGGGAITIASSAGGQSLMFSVPQTSSIVGVAPASISTNGSTISVQVSAIMGLGVSNTGNTAGNVGYLTGSNYALAGSGSITLSQSTAAGAATCYIQHPAWLTTAALSGDTSKYAGVNGSVATTAGTDLALTLNTSGATIGYPKWITTAAQSSGMMSWFQNLDMLDPGSSTMSYGGSVLQVCPFVLPHAMSVGFVRMAGSMSYVSTEASGTTANTTYTVNRSYTHAVMLFTQNTGGNSLSLNLLTSSSASWLFQNQIQAGAQGSRYTVTQNVTYPISGTTSNYTTSYPQSSANVQISSASLTLFTGPRFIDIPFGVSLPANNYWIAFGMSTNSATQAGNAALGGASAGFSMIAVTQNNLSFGLMGQVTNSSNPIQPGCGSWSTNAAVMTTASIGLASISAMSSSPKGYFQFIRYA